MADRHKSSDETEASRQFLESLLADSRLTSWPGRENFIKLIEEALAILPPETDSKFKNPPSQE